MKRTEFERVVDETIEQLPASIIDKIDNLVVVVEEHPSPELGGALGVYEGYSLSEREAYSGVLPDKILIFRQPHLALGLGDSELTEEIRRTVLHEIGHHLGIDDDRLEELGWD